MGYGIDDLALSGAIFSLFLLNTLWFYIFYTKKDPLDLGFPNQGAFFIIASFVK